MSSKYIAMYVITFISFLALDSVWLGVVAPKLYKNNIGHLMADKPNLGAALVFYLLYILGLLVFVLLPAVHDKNIAKAAYLGALFGLIAYATFDLTSQAVFKDWPTKITMIDMAWGTTVTTGVSSVAYVLITKFIVK
jgi:uncharacterized membrane protein